ncbi:MAG: phosphate transport system regulatory protein PhoU [Planctomycetes bacterium RIFOXYD12_FULL_42_12]|nr:MAG: phosphate transport system regulatory protein PhoU [Planctomycetes bacterium GWB2_41_19]OHB44637.1 MAG: phosphate transport system regulatory protein PhoU [Planctomycetes bacterium GWE2_41_14]OHC06589.1 MAG: phosphate transport system regulatory protein PhoU [Planctomycetes bacterium RIFOXYC2_FULL_41_27]OHC06828.1 MAG: phosphate transport system regulatory protein PhoU [Planctomycetes bacterium RIFOXYD12_FULL_42_12]
MERHFDQQLEALRKNLIQMASMVETAIANSVKSLITRDTELARLVVQSDEQVDALELEIDKQCVDLLALRQPLAIDLRFITSSIKITNNLERMGDLAVNIAERVIPLSQEPQLKPLIDIPRMATITQTMVKDSIDAFVNRDTELARSVYERDSTVDALNDQIFRELLTYMMQDPANITRAVHLILISRHLERIADHSTNIAEEVVYIVKAKVVKHRGYNLEEP